MVLHPNLQCNSIELVLLKGIGHALKLPHCVHKHVKEGNLACLNKTTNSLDTVSTFVVVR